LPDINKQQKHGAKHMKTVTITAELTNQQAQALAQFCKRVGFSDFRGCAQTDDEAYDMQYAVGKIRRELIAAGFDPR